VPFPLWGRGLPYSSPLVLSLIEVVGARASPFFVIISRACTSLFHFSLRFADSVPPFFRDLFFIPIYNLFSTPSLFDPSQSRVFLCSAPLNLQFLARVYLFFTCARMDSFFSRSTPSSSHFFYLIEESFVPLFFSPHSAPQVVFHLSPRDVSLLLWDRQFPSSQSDSRPRARFNLSLSRKAPPTAPWNQVPSVCALGPHAEVSSKELPSPKPMISTSATPPPF